MRDFPLSDKDNQKNVGLGLLCKVGFAMFSDSSTKWTREEIDEISAPGFCEIMLKIGAASERNGFIEMHNIDAEFGTEIYNQMNAARMRESRKRKKEEKTVRTHAHACEQSANACEQSANDVRNNNRIEVNKNLAHTQNARTGRPTPADAEEVHMFMKNLPHCGLTDEEAHHCASKFFDTQEAIGWVGPRGAALRDWKALARSFLTDWQNNKRNAYTNTPRKTKPVIDPREGLFDDPDRF